MTNRLLTDQEYIRLRQTTVEDDNAIGADETDPAGASFASGTLIGYAANLAAGGSFAVPFDARVN